MLSQYTHFIQISLIISSLTAGRNRLRALMADLKDLDGKGRKPKPGRAC